MNPVAKEGGGGKRSRLSIEWQILWIGALVLAMFALTQTVTLLNARAARSAEVDVQHALDVQNELQRLLGAVQDVETGYRGFVITGDEGFLLPYVAGQQVIPAVLSRLTMLMGDGDTGLAHLKTLVEDKVAYGEHIVALRRSQGVDGATAEIRGGEGKRDMDAIRTAVAAMATAETHRLDERRADATRRTQYTGYLALAAGLVLAAAVGAFLALARRDAARRAEMIEALRQSEMTMRMASDTLERSNRDLQDFAMIASHDLQEPLRKVLMFGDRLRDEAGRSLSPEALDYLRRMQNAADRGQTLIQGLLAYSRVTTKAQAPVPVRLTDVAREVIDDLEARLAQTGGQVRVDSLPTIEADPLQMRQLLQNLIGNALKFNRPDAPPRIELRARRVEGEDETWELAVSDNGIGFDEKYLDRIFKLFQRLHERNAYEGAGMGLAICRRIVERHGGTITATSTPGTGSTFLIVLPARQVAKETAA